MATRDDRALTVFLREIDYQGRIVFEHSMKTLQDRLADVADEGGRTALERAFIPLQQMIIACAAVSKMLWPSREFSGDEGIERARWLRQEIGLSGESPVQSRKARNALEHMDQRLDEMLAADRSMVDLLIVVPRTSRKPWEIENADEVRAIYVGDHTAVIWGENWDYVELGNEMARIVSLARQRWAKLPDYMRAGMPPLPDPDVREFRDQTVHINDLSVAGQAIENTRFINCTILGPAVLVPIGGNITDCEFDTDRNTLFWVVPASRPQITGAIAMKGVELRSCKLIRIGLAVPESELSRWQEAFGGTLKS